MMLCQRRHFHQRHFVLSHFQQNQRHLHRHHQNPLRQNLNHQHYLAQKLPPLQLGFPQNYCQNLRQNLRLIRFLNMNHHRHHQ